jgi:two-component system sensor histidine kinase/response regulator
MALDLRGALDRLGDDIALFKEFVGFYEEDYPRLIQNLDSAVQARNGDVIHHAAHALKGLVGSLGATQVASLAGSLERMGRAGDFSEIDSTLAHLHAEIEQLNIDLIPYRNTAPARKTGQGART